MTTTIEKNLQTEKILIPKISYPKDYKNFNNLESWLLTIWTWRLEIGNIEFIILRIPVVRLTTVNL